MALVQKIERLNLERPTVHGEVHCTYTSFADAGDRYFQLDTYGSKNRQLPGKKSQTIQLNAQSARALIDLLTKEFKLA